MSVKAVKKALAFSFFASLAWGNVGSSPIGAYPMNNDWKEQFKGEVTFELTDDGVYRDALDKMTFTRSELERVISEIGRLVSEIDRLNGMKAQSLSQLDQVRGQLQGSQMRLDQVNGEIYATQDHIARLDQEIYNLQNQIAFHQDKLREFRQKRNNVENKLANITPRIQKLENQIRNLRQANKKDKTALESKKSSLQSKKNKREQNKQKIPTLQSQVTNIQNQIPNVQSQITQLQTKIQNLKTKKQNLESKISNIDSQMSGLKSQLSTAQSNLKSKQSALSSAKTNLQNIKNNIASTKKKIDALKTKIANLKTQNQTLTGNLTTLRNELGQLKAKKTTLQTNLANAKTKLKNAQAAYKKALAACQAKPNPVKPVNPGKPVKPIPKKPGSLEEETLNKNCQNDPKVVAARDKVKAAKTKVQNINRKLQAVNSNIAAKNQKIKDTQSKISANKTAIASSQSSLNSLKPKLQQLKAKLEPAKQKVSTLQTQVANLKTKVQNLKAKLAPLEGKKSEAVAQLKTVKGNLQTAQTNIKAKKTKLANLKSSLKDKKAKIAALKSENQQLTSQIQALKNQIAQLQQQIQNRKNSIAAKVNEVNPLIERRAQLETRHANLTQKIKVHRRDKNQLEGVLARAHDDRNAAQHRMQGLLAERQDLERYIPELQQQIAILQDEINRMSQDIAHNENVLQDMRGQRSQLEYQLGADEANFQNVESELIGSILSSNDQAVNTANGHGSIEGSEIAQTVGEYEGVEEGEKDGKSSGTSDGRRREFNSGHKDGYPIGEEQGIEDGQKDGTILGTKAGNKFAGDVEGKADGIKRAENSDAFAVGTKAGNEKGLSRATNDGEAAGSPVGKSQAIESYESRELDSKSVSGKFAGAFSSETPRYPGSDKSQYNAGNNFNREVIKRSYQSGYDYGYFSASEQAFMAKIESVFRPIYDEHFRNKYEEFVNKYYGNSYKSGKAEGISDGHASTYTTTKDRFYAEKFEFFKANPQRSTEEFKTSFNFSSKNAYASKYAEIKRDAADAAEKTTYQSELPKQTEFFRQKKFDEIAGIYKSKAVVKFVSTDMTDGGVGPKKICHGDSVLQPNEDALVNVKVVNFSDVPAKGITVKIAGVGSVALPSIPAKSQTTVMGAAKKVVPVSAGVGSKFTTSTVLNYKSASKNEIVRRYFINGGGDLNTASIDRDIIGYPFTIWDVSAEDSIMLSKESVINGTIRNVSKKELTGPITLTLSTSLGDHIITKQFKEVDWLNPGGQTSTSAIIKVIDENEAYQDIVLTAKLTKDGVTLSEDAVPAKSLVKLPYIAKDGAPAVIMNSNTMADIELMKDVVLEMGGFEAVSLLDTTISSFDKSFIKKELKGKTMVVVPHEDFGFQQKIEKFFDADDSMFIFAGEGSLKETAKNVPSMKAMINGIYKVADEKMRVFSTNPHMIDKAKMVHMIEKDFIEIKDVLEAVEPLKVTGEGLISKVDATFDFEKFIDKEERVLGKALVMNIIADLKAINKAYLLNGKDKKIAKEIRKGGSATMVGKLLNSTESEGSILFASLVKEFLSDTDIFERKIGKAAFKSSKKAIKKTKKQIGKNKIKSIESVQSVYMAM